MFCDSSFRILLYCISPSLSLIHASRRGGLLFFLGHEQPEAVPSSVKTTASIFIVAINIYFFCHAMYKFGNEFIQDYKSHKQQVAAEKMQQEHETTHIVPIINNICNNNAPEEKVDDPEEEEEVEEAEEDFNHETSRKHVRSMLKHTRSTHAVAHALHNEFHTHEMALREKHTKQHRRSVRKTKSRVRARAELKRSKVMRKVRIFEQLNDQCLNNLIERMQVRNFSPNEAILLQGAPATSFYIIVTGTVVVTQKTVTDLRGHEVARLGVHSFFGEHALELGHNEFHVCNATVTAVDLVRTLCMENTVLEDMVKEGKIDRENLQNGIHLEQERREQMTKVKLLMQRSGGSVGAHREINKSAILQPKGLPRLPVGNVGERSLFS